MPDIITKSFHERKKAVRKIVFNQDKSHFALIWKCQIQETKISFYGDMPKLEMDYTYTDQEKTLRKKSYQAMKLKCEKYIKIEQ